MHTHTCTPQGLYAGKKCGETNHPPDRKCVTILFRMWLPLAIIFWRHSGINMRIMYMCACLRVWCLRDRVCMVVYACMHYLSFARVCFCLRLHPPTLRSGFCTYVALFESRLLFLLLAWPPLHPPSLSFTWSPPVPCLCPRLFMHISPDACVYAWVGLVGSGCGWGVSVNMLEKLWVWEQTQRYGITYIYI